MTKGIRSLRDHSLLAAGRSLGEQIEDIRKEGTIYTPALLRNSIVGGLEIRKKRGTAENVIVIGCACFGTALPLRSYCMLLQRLGIEYVFLKKEYCCGAPLLHQALLKGMDRKEWDDLCQEFIGLNINMAKEMGAKQMLYFCTWCAYLAKRFFQQCQMDEPSQLFYPDILSKRLEGVKLKLNATVGYFGGRSHRRPIYVPDENMDLGWKDYRGLLDSVEGLKVVDIPRYCCQIVPQQIFRWAQEKGLDTIVVSCIVCYGRLSRMNPPDVKIKFISDVLLEAIP